MRNNSVILVNEKGKENPAFKVKKKSLILRRASQGKKISVFVLSMPLII